MSRRNWFFMLGLIVASVFLDQITKSWITLAPSEPIQWWGPVGITWRLNPGVMLGSFSEAPSVLRIVSLSTGGAFIFVLFFVIQFLIPSRALLLRAGVSLMVGGILGNVLDRIRLGAVADFIVLRVGSAISPVFNLADAIQWVGYALIAWGLWSSRARFWPDRDLRKNYWVNPRFQLRYCLVLAASGIGFAVIAGVFTYTYFGISFREAFGIDASRSASVMQPFLITLAVIALTFGCLLFAIGLVISHKIAGPLYAFQRFLNGYLQGSESSLTLREGDEFRELETLAKKLLESRKAGMTGPGGPR